MEWKSSRVDVGLAISLLNREQSGDLEAQVERDDRNLGRGRQDVVAAEHEHRAFLVRRAEAKPPNLPPTNHGNSGSPSSSIGP